RDLGYVEGQNLLIEQRYANGRRDQGADTAAELVRLQPEVILVPAAPDARAVLAVTTAIPIVSAGAGDLVAQGLAASHARPGGHADGIVVSGGPVIFNNYLRIAELAIESRLPSMWTSAEAVGRGGLMAYGANLADNYRRAAYYVDRILQGTKPADLPIEEPRE